MKGYLGTTIYTNPTYKTVEQKLHPALLFIILHFYVPET